MKSKEVSLIPAHPFIQSFVFSIINNIRSRNFQYEKRDVVHADLVPKVSENVMMASMGERVILRREPLMDKMRPPRRLEIKKRDMSALIAPIELPVARGPIRAIAQVAPQIQVAPAVVPKKPTEPAKMDVVPMIPVSGAIDQSGIYGKISPLLNDPSVSSIECLGAGKELMILRAGQRQKTRIVLTKEDIQGILDKIADEMHIPLLDGVFRASVKGFSINAVISGIIGSKFVIKKATAYGLLE